MIPYLPTAFALRESAWYIEEAARAVPANDFLDCALGTSNQMAVLAISKVFQRIETKIRPFGPRIEGLLFLFFILA